MPHYIGLVGWFIGIAVLVYYQRTFDYKIYNLMGHKGRYYALSALILAICTGSLLTQGLHKGLDFTGGTKLEVGFYKETTVQALTDSLNAFKSSEFQLGSSLVKTGTTLVTDPHPEPGKPNQYQRAEIRLVGAEGVQLEPSQSRELLDHLKTEFGDLKELSTASIGPTISGELTSNALKAMGIAIALQLVYLFFRFGNQLRYGVAANLAMLHDVFIMVGVYSLGGRELDSPFVAAVLTVVGYSVMDSVVIFDRIRETLNNYWAEFGDEDEAPYEKLVNDAVNQTMTRSINTSLTALFTILAIYYFGGSTLQNFAYALLIGIIVAAYSSIFVASPLLISINNRWPARPYKAATWGSVDDEVVPEDYIPGAEGSSPARRTSPKKASAPAPVESPKLVDDSESSGGRRRSRGKRS